MSEIVITPKTQASACVIWMHGLGASGHDMAGLAKALPLQTPVKHIALHAPIRPVTINQHMPMPAWYDIAGTALTDREDEAGILASERLILTAVEAEISAGFKAEQIFLAGFSQGGAMALFTALNALPTLGGVIALSAYLPLATKCQPILNTNTPFFIASGRFDPIVLPDWTNQTVDWLKAKGFNTLNVTQYPMEHAVCLDEINDIAHWLEMQTSQLKASTERGVS